MEKDKDTLHYSVLKEESLRSLKLKPGLTVVDATVNRAGHAIEIAKAIGKTGTLIIFDLDLDALNYSKEKISGLKNAPRLIAVHSNYRNLKKFLEENNIQKVDRIFADLGLSSQEIEVSGRGFTFLKDEPLQMTYQSQVDEETFTAKDLVNNLSVANLERIFSIYGGEQKAWKIANAIVEYRGELEAQTHKSKSSFLKKTREIETTGELVKIIESVVPRSGKTHPATKVFQAIRIAVNDEFESIKEFVKDGYDLLSDGGILSIITFHSGEDRIVKNLFKEYETKTNKQEKFKPSRKEVLENKRSRSALLRTIAKE